MSNEQGNSERYTNRDQDEEELLGMIWNGKTYVPAVPKTLDTELRKDFVRVLDPRNLKQPAFQGGLSLHNLGLNKTQLKCEQRDNHARCMGFTNQFLGHGMFEDNTIGTTTRKLELQETEYERKIQQQLRKLAQQKDQQQRMAREIAGLERRRRRAERKKTRGSKQGHHLNIGEDEEEKDEGMPSVRIRVRGGQTVPEEDVESVASARTAGSSTSRRSRGSRSSRHSKKSSSSGAASTSASSNASSQETADPEIDDESPRGDLVFLTE